MTDRKQLEEALRSLTPAVRAALHSPTLDIICDAAAAHLEMLPLGERVCAWAEVREGLVMGFHTIKMRPVEGAEMVELVGYTKAKG